MNTLIQEKELIIAMQEGNELAFEKIYLLYNARLFGRLLRLVKSEVHSKEILQDVFLKLWEKRTFIDPEKSSHSYLFKIAENKVYDFFRKVAHNRNIQSQLVAIATSNYEIIENFKSDDEKLVALESTIQNIPPQRQQVFRLRKPNSCLNRKEILQFFRKQMHSVDSGSEGILMRRWWIGGGFFAGNGKHCKNQQ